MSTPSIEQLAESQKANAEVLLNLLRTAFTGIERLTALNIAATREFFNDSVASTQQLLAAKDANAVAELAKPSLDKWLDYSRKVYELSAEVQKELTGAVETQYATFTKNATSAVESAKANAPIGGDVFSAAFKSVIDASSQAFENITSVTKQLTELAESNLQTAAAKPAAPAAKSATAAARKAAAK